MKAILFFVAAGIVREHHREAATAINAATNKRVVFRNGSVGDAERPEANEGVAGFPIPAAYASAPHYDNAGKLISAGEAPAAGDAPERKLNAFGVPDEDGAPTDRESLKSVLDDAGVEYHANASTEKLVGLYMAHFYPEA